MVLTTSHRRLLALAGSFLVYLLPILGPHAAFLVGEVIANGFSDGGQSAGWVIANIGFALLLQLITFGILLWALRRPPRLAALVVVVPAMWFGAQAMYLAVIPAYFLIEPDTAAETNTFTERCTIDKASLLAVRTPIDLPTLPVEEWWLQYPDGSYGLLRAADCAVAKAALPQATLSPEGRADFTLGFSFYVPGRGAIVERLEPPTGRRTWWLLRDASTPLSPIAAPGGQEIPPILSNDGDVVVWQQTIPGTGPPVLTRLIVQRLSSAEPDVTIDLSELGPGSYTTAALDARAHAVTLWRNDDLIVVGFDGVSRGAQRGQISVRFQPQTYRVGPDGSWIAWDAYKEDGPYRIEWMTDRGGGLTLPKGRSFTDAAFDPARRLIAFSASTTLSIGDTTDLVAIVRADNGTDVFRRYLARYSRSPTVFFAGGSFGYSDDKGVHVVAVGP